MTDCTFEPDGQQADERGRNRYVCGTCGAVRRSTYDDPSRIHRRCGAATTKPKPPPCMFIGKEVDEIEYTSRCGQPARARVYGCDQFGRCVRRPVQADAADGLAVCVGCEYEPIAGPNQADLSARAST